MEIARVVRLAIVGAVERYGRPIAKYAGGVNPKGVARTNMSASHCMIDVVSIHFSPYKNKMTGSENTAMARRAGHMIPVM